MSSPTDKVAQAKAAVEQAKNNRSASLARTSPTSSAVNVPATVPERAGPAANNGGGVAGTDGAKSRAGPEESSGGGNAGKQGATDPSSDDDEAEEEAQTPAPPRRTEPPASARRQTTPPQAPAQRRPSQVQGASTAESFATLVHNLTNEQKQLLEELVDINGQDSYDALAAGIGKLKKSEYLLLPRGFTPPNVPPSAVGKPAVHAGMSIKTLAQIYAMNKSRAPTGSDDKIFAMLRMEAVKCGWITDQREIEIAEAPNDALTTLANDLREIRERLATIKTASFLVPLAAEHVFRTFGHHFISSDASNYTERYNSTFRSCLASEVVNLLPAPTLFHAALHWVSPARARAVLMAQLTSASIPDALRIRANAAPAGTAILTTTSAILRSMDAVGISDLFKRHGGFDIDLIHLVTEKVKQDPPRYHKTYFAYGVEPLSRNNTEQLETAKEEAIKFAPFAQAYIQTYMREAALGRAQALKKHAEQNPIQMRRAINLFRNLGKAKVTSVADLFITTLGRGDDEDDF